MAITEAQRGKLSKYIGASRIAAVLGKDPWKTAEDVRLEMLGLVEPQEAGHKAKIGTYLEPSIMRMISDGAGVQFSEAPEALEFFHPGGVMIAHPDGITATRTKLAEAKLTSLADDWGPAGDHNGLPTRVLLQVVGQFACVEEAEVCYVGCFVVLPNDYEFRLYTVERPAPLVREVVDAVGEWHAHHIIEKRPCEDAARSLESMKRMKREPEAVVEVSPVLLDTLLDATEARKLAEKAEDAAQGELLAAMGNAAAGRDANGRQYWLKTESAGMRVNMDRFKTEYAQVYADLAEPATRKMPRWSGLPKKARPTTVGDVLGQGERHT